MILLAFLKPALLKNNKEKTMKFNAIDWLALALVIVGGLNWGLVGAFNFNLVDTILGEGSAISRIVYCLVGLSAVYMLYAATKLATPNHHGE
jgi:uncharacterized membrane protein YuzA (DUF378 family)